MTARDYQLKKGLPKQTTSICPECKKLVDAVVFERDGAVFIKKTCEEHGTFEDVYWSDVELYLKAEEFAYDGIGVKAPCSRCDSNEKNATVEIGGRQFDMMTNTALANIDLTNRCNMRCPICFANANAAGYVYEPDYETVVKMLEMLRAEEPIPCTAVQFSGGEPTIYPQFIDIIKKARELHFAQIQVATNGISFANDFQLLKDAVEAGMNTIYLSFDGVSDDVYLQARDRKMFDVKLRLLDNIRKLEKRPSVVLVPTIVRGINDHQVGDILKFAFENSDVVRGVNYQPVAFTGRITKEEREKGRYTLTDLVNDIGSQTGYTVRDDWYPVPTVAPISKFVSAILGENKVTFTTHPHCGIATYLFRDQDGEVVPIPRFINVKKFSEELYALAEKAEKSRFKGWYKYKAMRLIKKSIIKENVPQGLKDINFINILAGVMSDKSKTSLAEFSWKMMFVGGMHFQDDYNYDVERVRRCAIHYATPDLEIIPFCAYNGGPEFRAKVESEHSVPLDEWKAKKGGEHC
ncbi:MAG: 7,8-dihydro-6-hydroxymethylpterin dimethyltransferase [Candidatus Methanomethylophilaceae archaeon]|nr:7,8-dihydro-6-hydroxymethylpterin dimethyltransferase [Candidatus Methanomethylophilaceae archaeon]MDI3541773.1 7,8-dihydro-6-hydroxymethylpterin dimethyltransferase [Candidatus Methanomethylophilaceae archaeon]HIJ00152.1 radical SAM protein [Candidatus Methanomethylophilaceae archaeon]